MNRQPAQLAPDAPVATPAAPKPKKDPIKEKEEAEQKVDVTQLRYVCIFVGHDLYGTQARRYVKTFMADHVLIEASSMEAAMEKMRDHSRTALKGGHAARIDEVVLIAHGNAAGFVKIPLIPGQKGITPEALGQLQDKFQEGALQKFQEARVDLLPLFDENTNVIVRGCRIGRSQEAVDALAAFFGGQARVYAPTEYQAFTRRKISSFDRNPRRAAVKAFDHLAMQGFVPQEAVATDDDKVRWVAAHLPDGFVPESFLVDEADVAKVRGAGADDAAIQSLKDYQSAQLIGTEKWGVSAAPGPEDEELDGKKADDIVKRAADHLKELRRLEKDEPDNWRAIGAEAWEVLRCDHAWRRKPEAMEIKPDENNGDPLAGLSVLSMPGLSYDTNVLAGQAATRPDLKVSHKDAFETANLVMPATPPSTETEILNVAEGQSKPGPPPSGEAQDSDNPYDEKPSSSSGKNPSAPAGGRGKGPSSGEIVMPPDRITPTPPMPTPPLGVDVGEHGAKKADTALVVRGEFTRSFEIKYERSIGYLKVKKAVVDLNGKIDFKGEGEKELVIGAFGALSSKPGESVTGGGDKLEGTIAKGQDKETGISGKVTGGLSLGGQGRTKEGGDASTTARGAKAEIYLGAQVAWGPVAQELKLVVVGIDETKSGTDMFTILGIKWSPIVVQGDFDFPVSDGTKVKFSGSIKLTIEAEPDWGKIAARLAPYVGRQVAVDTGVMVAGGTATGGAAAGAGTAETGATAAGGAVVGELVVTGAFVAVAAALVYAYYKSVQDIEDLKELQRGADQGVDDFCGGYLAYLGISGGGQSSGAFWKEGQRHAEIQLNARVKRAAQFLNEKYQNQLPQPFREDDPELRAAILGGTKQDADSWRRAVRFSYETAIRTLFYKAWLQRVRGTDQERNATYARARAGLSSVEPTDEPDYDWVNAVGSHAATGMRPPTGAR